jgi:predicted enzyme related to lactoylglutathione lyase
MNVYVYTEEMEKLQSFYEAALGVKPQDYGDWKPFTLASTSTFALHAMRAHPDDQHRGFNFSIEVDDIDAALARCEAHGARVLQGVSDESFGKRAVIEDPDGRTLYLVQNEMEEPQ